MSAVGGGPATVTGYLSDLARHGATCFLLLLLQGLIGSAGDGEPGHGFAVGGEPLARFAL